MNAIKLDYSNLTSIKDVLVSLTTLNRGGCSKILDDLKSLKDNGIKFISKNNNVEGIIMSCEYFDSINKQQFESEKLIKELQAKIEKYEDERIYLLTKKRLNDFNPNESISKESMMQISGITQAEIDACGEVDFE
ncbi:hypothetical protein [Romboutsia sp.]|uniref:hypothetical protein n=1 Tax=Romboutsia sp. TaxID=1965302 RepID=UPI003F41363D